MLGTLEGQKKEHWSKHVAALVHAYNATQNDATGYSPYFLMFGREARLPIDVCFGTNPDNNEQRDHITYAADLRQRLQDAYRRAEEEASKKAESNKKRYDSRVRGQELLVGDRVLIRNLGFKGPHKLADRWDSTIYIVVERINPSVPVYRLRPENGNGPIKTLHRNHILPVGYLRSKTSENTPPPLPVRRRSERLRQRETPTAQSSSSEDDSDSDYIPFVPAPMDTLEDDITPLALTLTDDEVPSCSLSRNTSCPPSPTPMETTKDETTTPSQEKETSDAAAQQTPLRAEAAEFVPAVILPLPMQEQQPEPAEPVQPSSIPSLAVDDASVITSPSVDNENTSATESQVSDPVQVEDPPTVETADVDRPDASAEVADDQRGENQTDEMSGRPKRYIRPPPRLTYNELGQPSTATQTDYSARRGFFHDLKTKIFGSKK